MSSMNDLDAGRLIEKIEQLTVEVKGMKRDIDDLRTQMSKGKGIVIGVLLLASGAGAGVASAISKIMGP